MADDASQGWMWFGNVPQSQATAGNSQCSVDLSNSSMSLNPNDQTVVTVHLSLRFQAGLPGPQQIWMQAGDTAGTTAYWQQMGTWTTSTVACPNCAPTAVSETPPGGSWSGPGGTFAYRGSSPNGWAYLTEFSTIFTTGTTLYLAPNACRVDYNRLGNTLALETDAGGYDSNLETTLGVNANPAVIQNSQCIVNAAQSSAQKVDDNTLELDLAITFKTPWVGTAQTDHLYLFDRAYRGGGWLQAGPYTIGSGAPPPDFSVGIAPSSSTSIIAGGSATYTVTVTPTNSFGGAVSFQASGLLPSGATASFNPATVTGSGTSTMTVTTSSSGGTGTFAPAVMGTSGSLTHTSAASTLTVNPAATPGFSMSVTATSATTITAGQSASYAVSVSAYNGFNSQVSFSVTSGLPVGATVAFSPAYVTGSGTSTMTVTTATSTAAGTYSLQVTTSGGGVSQTGYAGLTVKLPAPDFTVSVGSATTAAGSNAVYTVTVTPLNGFSGTVNYQVSGLPALAGVISYSTQGWQTTMTVGTQSCTPLGTATPTLTATSGSLIHSYGFGLTVTNPGVGAPVVCGISPTSGQVGTPVTITGVNFGNAQGTVSFGSQAANVTSWGAAQITAQVPSGFTSATIAVTSAIGNSGSSPVPFVVASVTLTPSSAQPDDWVTVTCVGFTCTQAATTSVTFNGVPAAATQNWTATGFQAQVPNTTSGPISVTETNFGAVQANFTVIPKVTSLSMTQGPALMGFVISGKGFGVVQQMGSQVSTVTLGGSLLTVVAWGLDGASITVQIPPNTPSGNVIVTVGDVQSRTSGATNFTIGNSFGCQVQ